MTVCNINYQARLLENTDHLPFRPHPPQMHVCKCKDCTIIIFKSGKCRIMGCRQPLQRLDNLPFKLQIIGILSVTVKFDMPTSVSLYHLGRYCYKNNLRYLYEPELFPALRLSMFDPLCVNVFASGKCIILGIKHLCYQKYVRRIRNLINTSRLMTDDDH